MAKSTQTKEPETKTKTAATEAKETPQQAPARPTPPEIDESKAGCAYANFCRVTGTPEELIVDFGLNSQPMGVQDGPLEISQRIVLNFFTAKRLLGALQVSVQRHEAAFGVLETNVQKRVQPNVAQ